MKKFVFTAASVFLFAASASAQNAAPLTEQHLNQLDQGKNGSVDRAEYQKYMTGAFAKFDTDNDGLLKSTDVTNVLTPEQFALVDANKDGQVSREEFMNQFKKDYASADRGGDGELK